MSLGTQGCLWYTLVLLLLTSELALSTSPREGHPGANPSRCSEGSGSLTLEANIALGEMRLFL